VHKTLTVKLAKEERKLEVKSDMVWKNAKVELGGDTVAEIHRDIRGREVADKQTVSDATPGQKLTFSTRSPLPLAWTLPSLLLLPSALTSSPRTKRSKVLGKPLHEENENDCTGAINDAPEPPQLIQLREGQQR